MDVFAFDVAFADRRGCGHPSPVLSLKLAFNVWQAVEKSPARAIRAGAENAQTRKRATLRQKRCAMRHLARNLGIAV
ncbi:hypothetical protein PSAC2689_10129 [Paraburkholderia sacchari]